MLRAGWRFRTSSRLSVQFSLLYAGLTAAAFIAAYMFTNVEVRSWVLEQMQADLQSLRSLYSTDGPDGLRRAVDILSRVSFESERIFLLVDDHGTVLAGNIETAPLSDGYVPLDGLVVSGAVDGETGGYWVRRDTIGPFVLLQGVGDHIVAEVLEALGWALALGFVLMLAGGLWAGVRVGRLTEAKIARISATLDKVAQGDLSARIPTRQGRSDLARVSGDVNKMLDQVEHLLISQEQISNDIAHDLRIPLQRLRQRLERMATLGPASAEEIAASIAQTEDIIATFNALLRIAQIEAGNRTERFIPLDLGALLSTVAEVFEPAAEDAQMTLQYLAPAQSLVILGDKNLLMQMFSNIIENAVRHCPAGTKISLSVLAGPEAIDVRVIDDGPGIPEQDINRVFDRFVRGEKSRSTPGNGLGLALVRAIAQMHGGTVRITNTHPGTTVTARFMRLERPDM